LIEGFGILNVVGKRTAKLVRSRTMKSNQRIVFQPENIQFHSIATQIGTCLKSGQTILQVLIQTPAVTYHQRAAIE
jgi:hypothetical protein